MPTPEARRQAAAASNRGNQFALRHHHGPRKLNATADLKEQPVDIRRKVLFESERLQIGFFAATNVSDQCGDVERQDRNLVVLPLAGLFAKHEAPGRQAIGSPSHAVFFAADAPYRLSFPGGKGDRAIILRFDGALAEEHIEAREHRGAASNGLLGAEALTMRSLLCTRLKEGDGDALEIETRGLNLLTMSLQAMRPRQAFRRESSEVRWVGAIARVTEAVAAAPAKRWSIGDLAAIARQSPYHLCRVFRERTGVSVYDYVLRERLAASLDAVLDGEDLTAVALDFGFASHSHFTARFRAFFGITPATLRRRMTADRIAEWRKIMTARKDAAILQ
jgi:AraC-like DNA-binding protein